MKTSVSNSIVETEAQAEQARKAAIELRMTRYGNTYPQPLVKNDLDPTGADNTIVNYSRRTVDDGADFLFGKPIAFGVTKKGDAARAGTQTTPEEDWLADCWKQNRGDTLLIALATSGGIAGDAYIRLLEPEQNDGMPEIVSIDPEFITATYDQTNINKVLQWRQQWTGIDSMNYAQPTAITYRILFTRQDSGKWLIEDQESVGDDPTFTTVSTRLWPYSFCPVFHCQNMLAANQFYGLSDLEDDVLHLNDAINFNLSNTNRILRAHAHPQQYVSGQGQTKVERGVGNVLYMPNPQAKFGSVEMISDLSSSNKQLAELRDAYADLTHIPAVVSGKVDDLGQLSGLALQILYGPLIRRTGKKRLLYGEMLEDVCKALLEMNSVAPNTVKAITIQWPELLPSDPQGVVNTAISKKEVGVSNDTLLSEMGYDPKAESEKRNAEAKQALDMQAKAFNGGGGPQDDKEDDNGDD